MSIIDRSSVSRGARIAHRKRAWEIGQSTDATRVPLLKGNGILIRSV